jgi:glycosyltransferase involved in cell wall biosynthesis
VKPRAITHAASHGIILLPVITGRLIRTKNRIIKGMRTLLLPHRIIHLLRITKRDRFDLVIAATPPVTFAAVLRYLKKHDGAASYLLLKDIFPQNAVDLGLLREHGAQKPLVRYFRAQETALYHLSDFIGCMSQANIRYLLGHHPELDPARVELCPNSIIPRPIAPGDGSKGRRRLGIPQDAVAFVLAGSLGLPQGIAFLLRALERNLNRGDRFFILCGSGTESPRVKNFITQRCPRNLLLIDGLSGPRFDRLLRCCDVGLLTLDPRFTIPNFPSRILRYMEQSLPVLAATDAATDIGWLLTGNGFGWWCESGDPAAFTAQIDRICKSRAELPAMGGRARETLEKYYTAKGTCQLITAHFKAEEAPPDV